MFLSDISVKRPVFAAVINLLVIAFGILSFSKLPLREYPDIDPPVVSIRTNYVGASANVVETRITELIEERIAGVEDIKSISSSSEDGRSRISVEFDISRNIDDAANDLRDRVSGILNNLPEEADPPEVQKSDSNDDVILWLNFTGEGMSLMELTDYADRYLVDRFSALSGVARVRIGGGQEMALRIWIDKNALAARQLTVGDIESALRSENVELPAGSIESITKDFTVRMERSYKTLDDFRQLVISRGESDDYLVRLSDVARVTIGAVESRTLLRGNGIPMVGIGIIKQSKANTIEVARLAKQEMKEINRTLPEGMSIKMSYDTSVFIESSIEEVYKTLFIAVGLVVLIIYVFLGNARAMLVPSVTVPVSLIGTFIILYAFGFTINLLTLLALILAIGLVVDDAIVVIENIHRRVEMGEPRVVAAFRGTRQVGFAVVATTAVLVSVFIPITFIEGDIGRLFTEFAITMSAAVIFSSFVALSFSPMLASKLLDRKGEHSGLTAYIDRGFNALQRGYLKLLNRLLGAPFIAVLIIASMLGGAFFLINQVQREFAPKEDRGAFFMFIRGPEGASYDYTLEHLAMVEERLMPFAESGEFQRLLIRAPGSFGTTAAFNDGIGIAVLSDWSNRKPIWYYVNKVRELTADIPGVSVFPVVRQAFGGGNSKPVQLVLGGPTYEDLVAWRDIILAKAAENEKLLGLEGDFRETKPQMQVTVNQDRAATLGVSTTDINRTMETLLGSRRVTTFLNRGEEYDVILESEKDLKQSPLDISNLYVRSQTTGNLIPLSNLVELKEFADAKELNRYNRLRTITLEANLAEGYSLGEALDYLENLIRTELPAGANIDYKGESQDYIESGYSLYFVFGMSLIIVFLVLAGQFESFIHPFVIMLTVPMAITGALFALWTSGLTLNIYSQIGLVILVGLAAKNGILIVEFINQLRDEGTEFKEAILEATSKRLRPIIMTTLTTVMGAVPLILSSGAGAETRLVIGVVIFTGVMISTILTLFTIPTIYYLIARNTTSPNAVSQRLESLLKEYKHEV